MSPRRLLSVLVAVVVAGVYGYTVFQKGARQQQLFGDALAKEGCSGDVVVKGVDSAKGRVEGATTYASTLVTACGSDWWIEVASGDGAAPRVTKTTKKGP